VPPIHSSASRLQIATVWREWLVLTALLCAFTALGVHERWFWRLDTMLYDAGLSLWARPAPSDIILVAIDEPSLKRFGRWPWSRTRLADAITAIAADHPRAILLDLLLAEPETGDAGRADQALAAALRAAGTVVLPSIFAGNATELVPLPAFQAAARLGQAHLELDPDGIARTVYLHEGLNRSRRPHVALALLEAAGEREVAAAPAGPAADDGVWRRADWRYIPFAGPPGHFLQVPIMAVLDGTVRRRMFEDAYVLVGATAAGLGDANPTPTSGFSRPMPGIEVNANVLAALRSGDTILPVATGSIIAASLLALGALLAAYLVLASRGALIATALAFCATLAAALVALRAGSVWLPPATLLVAILLAYPLWSWRRLEAAQRFLDRQLADLGTDASGEDPPVRVDPLLRRITRVRAAQVRLSQAIKESEDFMKFLSHDMRAPLSSIIAEIELRRLHARPGLTPVEDDHFAAIEAQARKSLVLAEEFVQLAKTGRLTPVHLVPVDLSAIADEAVDQAWALAREKGVRLESEVAPEAWARGEPRLLARALFNLLHNAIKFTPAGGVVRMAVERHGERWHCLVSDEGPGIAEPAQRSLLDSAASTAAAPGVGLILGLALVKAVAERHQGALTIRSTPGQGAVFLLDLPVDRTAMAPADDGNAPRR
jgi:CHASE2 domain-containing sensor protein/anti-sigma regulatory factor (Ser/Thr protein kinase)